MSTTTTPPIRPSLHAIGALVGRHTIIVAYAVMALLFIVTEILLPGFDTPGHLSLILSQAAILGIVAAGQTVVVLTGGIDLSVGAMMSLAGVTLTGVSNGTNSGFAAALAVALVLGIAVGLINGLGIALLRVPPLVMTLGMGGILTGVTLVSTNGTPSGSAPPASVTLATGTLFNVPIAILVWAAVTLALVVLLRLTVFGRQLYALGNSPRVSILSGVNPLIITLAIYALSGAGAAFAGILLTGQNGNANTSAGDVFLLPSVAAVVVGGTSILGGRGGYGGTVAGAIIITVLQAFLQAKGIAQPGQDILYGILILVMLFLYGREVARRS